MSKYKEKAIEPELEIIDTHHHLWPDVVSNVGFSAPYSIKALLEDVNAGHNIAQTIFVECTSCWYTEGPEHLRPVGETEWIVGHENVPEGVMSGIVGFVDLRYGELAGEALDAHIALAGKRFKGIRHSTQWDPHPTVYHNHRNSPPHLLLDETFGKGLAELDKRGLVYETFLSFHQIEEVGVIAREHPNLKIVICHLGTPFCDMPYGADREKMLTEWRREIATLAKYPNVIMKLGGFGFKPMCPDELKNGPCTSEAIAEYWKPEIMYCVEQFGANRCMFESNFPPDEYLCDYVTLWNACKLATKDLPAEERQMLFSGTAKWVYSLD